MNNSLTDEQKALELDCLKDSNPNSKVGQLIGNTFENTVISAINQYLQETHPDYEVLQPKGNKKQVRLEMAGGLPRQLDNVISLKHSDDPIALMETKWLKDARHHNDKGAWILQLREVRKNYPTVRGAAAILAGYWTSGVGVMLMSEGGVKMVIVASDEQIYSTLQPHVDAMFGDDTFTLDAKKMRQKYIRPKHLRQVLCRLVALGELEKLAIQWLQFSRDSNSGNSMTGLSLIHQALDDLLKPLPKNPKIVKLEIALQVDTGNTIYKEFQDLEEAQDFIQTYFSNSAEILNKITPKLKSNDD